MKKIITTNRISVVDEIGKWMSEPHPLNVKACFELNGYTDKESDELLVFSEPILYLMQESLNNQPVPELRENKAKYILLAEKLSAEGSTEKVKGFALNILAQLEKIL